MHRSLIVIAVLLSLAHPWKSVAAGTTPQRRFKAALDRVIPPIGALEHGKLKKLCVCIDSKRAGAVESVVGLNGVLGVTCAVYDFAADGSVSSISACYDWIPVTR